MTVNVIRVCRNRRQGCGLAFVAVVLFLGVMCVGASGDSALPDAFDGDSLLWELVLGTHQYTVPRVDGGRVFIGINDLQLDHPAAKRTGGGILMCLDEATGRMEWQFITPRYMDGVKAPYHFNQWKCGICSRPEVDGKRLYIVGSRGEVLCLDREGQGDGNDGPFVDELQYMGIESDSGYKLTAADGDIVWRYDLIKGVGSVPHDVCGCTPLVHGDYVYANSSNGQDDKHKLVANPKAPSLVVLDKKTGRLVATDGELIGERMFHGHWSSPVAAEVGGREMILFGGGDGVLYAFEPVAAGVRGGEVLTLKKIWEFDCNPADYRERDGEKLRYSRHNDKSSEGPSEVIATPVVYEGRVYISIGQSPVHGVGNGALSCVDVATGEKVWQSRLIGRSLSEVLIHDGLLYSSDFSGRLHCFDPETGQRYWYHELEAGVWHASPAVADGRIYVSTEKNLLWVFKAGREKQVISRSKMNSAGITTVYENGVLYVPTQRRLFAVKMKGGGGN